MNAITGVGGLSAPGWYADADGVARWWDGGAWGPAAPPRADHSLAVIAHLGWIAGGFIVSLVIRLTADKRDEFTVHHASEALNLRLIITAFNTLFAGAFVLPMFGAVMTMDLRRDETLVPMAWLAWVGSIVVLNLVHFIVTALSIYAAVQAGCGRGYRLPLPFRIVPGAKPAGYQPGQVSP